MPLFKTRLERAIFICVCAGVLALNLAREYSKYLEFMHAGEQEVTARVKLDYLKHPNGGRAYRVLRLETGAFDFYTIAGKKEKIKPGDLITAVVSNTDVSFANYLSGLFYMPSRERRILGASGEILGKKTQNLTENESEFEPILSRNFEISAENSPMPCENLNRRERSLNFTSVPPPSPPNALKERALNFIAAQHENPKISQLYAALFLGESVYAELRDDVVQWGAAHLIAISGYHLGVMTAAIFLVAAPIYRYFSARFFPWRDYKFDVGALALVVCVLYFRLIGFIPSFARALAMSAFGFFLLARGIKILSFETLFIVVCALTALMPSLALNVGFYFSCAGVFYIFLYLRYFSGRFNALFHAFALSFYVFFAMQACVLYFFPLISFQQIAVVPLEFIFTLFYPASFLAHAAGLGGAFDEILQKFLAVKFNSHEATISFWFFALYNALSLLAIKFKPLFWLPLITGIGCFIIFCA